MIFEYMVGLLAMFVLLLVVYAIRIFREYERGVVFLLGRFQSVKGPGLVLVVPFLQTVEKVDLRTVVMDVPSQDVISRDNVSVKVSAVVYFRVIDPQKAIINVEQYGEAVSKLAQPTLRSLLVKDESDGRLEERDMLSQAIQEICERTSAGGGIKISIDAIKLVELDETIVRA